MKSHSSSKSDPSGVIPENVMQFVILKSNKKIIGWAKKVSEFIWHQFTAVLYRRDSHPHWYQINDKIQFLIYWLNSSRQKMWRRTEKLQHQHHAQFSLVSNKFQILIEKILFSEIKRHRVCGKKLESLEYFNIFISVNYGRPPQKLN